MEAALAMYDALVKINVPHAAARDVVTALERDMGNTLATKSDIALLKADLQSRYELMESRLSLTETRITVRLGGLIAAGIGLLATLLTVYRC